MDWTNPALTALMLTLVYTLVKVVEYFLNRRNGKSGLTIEDKQTLKALQTLSQNNLKISEKLEEMHSVYDENHVPKWYVPAELLGTVRSLNTELSILNKEIRDTMGEIKAGQSVLVDKLSDLINSQRLMTERLGDLIMKLNNKMLR